MQESSKEWQCLLRTLEIRQVNGFNFPQSLDKFKIELRYSKLFERLLSGKEPLPHAPPKSFNQPWYSLIEDGYGYPFDVWEAKTILTSYPSIGIDNHLWHLTDKISDTEFIIQYVLHKRGDSISQYTLSSSVWRVFVIGQRSPLVLNIDNNLWKIEKLYDI